MDFVDEFIYMVKTLSVEQQAVIRDRLDKAWTSNAMYGNPYDMQVILQAFNNLQITGKVTFPKLMSTLGIKKQEDKNRFLAFVNTKPFLFTVKKGEITEVFLTKEMNPLTHEFKVSATNTLANHLFILEYNNKLWLTQFSYYMSLVNTKYELNMILNKLGIDISAGKQWNPLDIYNFNSQSFESVPCPVWEISKLDLDRLSLNYTINKFTTRGFSQGYSLNILMGLLRGDAT